MKRIVVVVSACVAAQLAVAAPAGADPLTAGWHATLTDPTPATGLSAVSCVSSRYCLALGSQGEVWDGASWVARPGLIDGFDVSCTSVSDCMIAGAESAPTGGDPRDGYITPMLAHWDGSTFTRLPLPTDPLAAGWASTVSCTASNACMAAAGPVVLRWDGADWVQTPTPTTAAGAVWVYDVACTKSTQCIAVGADPAGTAATMLWDGSTWTEAPAPPFAPLQVDCDGADWCMAVGSSAYYPTPVDGGGFGDINSAAVWNGSAWTSVTLADAPWEGSFYANVLSCGGRASCAVVSGDVREHWDGRAWSVTPGPAIQGAGPVALHAVDCPDATTCFGVGMQQPTVQVPGYSVLPYAERWSAS